MSAHRADDDDAAPGDAQDAVQDSLLVERVLRGDREAYGILVSRHMRRAFAIAYRTVEHRQDAEDVVQDAFIAALEHLDQLERGRPFRPWFFRIVVNRALNFRRRRTVRATEQIAVSTASAGALPDRAAEQSDLRFRLVEALETLSEKQRTIVQLADLEGLTSAEIGEIMELADGTVRWHLHDARRRLRALLTSSEEET